MPLKIKGNPMSTITLKEHTLYDEANEAESINYQGHGLAFLKKDLSEKLSYCEDLEREEAQAFFNDQDNYYFGECSLDWGFTAKPTMGRGKVSMFFAKYWKNGYFEQPFEG
jgi:hypothetical protein